MIPKNTKDEIVLYQPNEQFQLEVQLKDETVWLNLQQIALLFDRDRTVIARRIQNVYAENELDENITCAKFAHMGTEGDQTYETKYYNLDVIISVGYRVKSQRGVQFRQWATKIIKDYMLCGYAVNQRLLAVEEQVDKSLKAHERRLEAVEEKIDFFVRTSGHELYLSGSSDMVKSVRATIALIGLHVKSLDTPGWATGLL